MLYPHKKLDETIQGMKSFGDYLMPYNFPKVPQSEEDDVNYIKTREVCVDGYSVILHYSKADYDNYFLETLQILSKHCPFLAFSLVCKIGKRFLGEDHLSLVELFKENRKIYCWTRVTDRKGEAVSGPYLHEEDLEKRIYEGLSYRKMNPKNVNFY